MRHTGEVAGIRPGLAELSDPVPLEMKDVLREHYDTSLLVCPDYLDTPENTKALTTAVANVFGMDDPQQFLQSGYVPSVDHLELAYALAIRRGTITPYVQPTQPQQISRPPVMPSASAPYLGSTQSVWEMPLDELKRKAGI
jgi:hypothetical protein